MQHSSRVLPTIVALIALLLAGCGDDGDGKGQSKPEQTTRDPAANALAFIECFDLPGYEAKRPKPREESLFAFTAKRKGFRVAAVNVTKKGSISTSAFLAVFESQATARRAMDELATTAVGDVKPQQKGPAVIGYLGPDDLKAVGPAIGECFES